MEMIHFQSKRQKCVSLSSCEADSCSYFNTVRSCVPEKFVDEDSWKGTKDGVVFGLEQFEAVDCKERLGKARHLMLICCGSSG